VSRSDGPDIAPLVTVEDYQRALDTTLSMLEEVLVLPVLILSTDPDMPGHLQTMADADKWLDACRRALEEAKAREASGGNS
jgi:hypothetical protein